MFKNVASPIAVGALRGIVVGLLVALATFGTLYGAGANGHTVVAGVIGAAIPVWLGFLGYGAYDKSRASAAASGDPTAVHASDVHLPVSAPVVVPVASNVGSAPITPLAPLSPVESPTVTNSPVSGMSTPHSQLNK